MYMQLDRMREKVPAWLCNNVAKNLQLSPKLTLIDCRDYVFNLEIYSNL